MSYKSVTILLLFVGLLSIPRPSPAKDYRVTAVQEKWRRVDRVLDWPTPRLLWQGEPLVAPRGLNLFGNLLFVTDPGDRQKPQERPARIVKFTLVDGVPLQPVIFFSRPGFLFSAKWSVPVTVDDATELVIADQGEEMPDGTFTGAGAKVFVLPVSADGTAGEPEVLWAGPPFKCPTGVARVESYLYITDPCAGPIITRYGRPDEHFPSSAIFVMPIHGGQRPALVKKGAPFTSLIGMCPATPGQLIVNDTDSGRLDPSGAGGRAGFAPPAGADRWMLKILSTEPPALSAPVRTPFTEEGPMTLKFADLPPNASITLSRGPKNLILDPFHANRPEEEITFPASQLDPDGTITFTVATDVLASYVCVAVRVTGTGISATASRIKHVDLWKDEKQSSQFVDNKHGGAKPAPAVAAAAEGSTASAAPAENLVYNYFTTDSAPGHAAVWIYPQGGGTPVAISKGAPLVRPLAGQLSADDTELWLTDQATGSLYVMPFPGDEIFDLVFPYRQRSF